MTDSQISPSFDTPGLRRGMTYRIDAPAAYQSTKSYGHEMGFSCCFRQWRADSHCRLLHGYALAFKFVFESKTLDVRNWVVDFGGLKPLKAMLQDTFDHTLLVAEDDPKKQVLLDLDRVHGIARVVEVSASGCERTAELVYQVTEQWLKDAGYGHVHLVSVEVAEHGANSAVYVGERATQVGG